MGGGRWGREERGRWPVGDVAEEGGPVETVLGLWEAQKLPEMI